MKNLLLLSVSFFIIFMAFSAAQNYQTSLYPNSDTGFFTLAILYAVLTCANLFTPAILHIMGNKTGLILGASTYAVFVFSSAIARPWLSFMAAGILGIGAALLWNAQGTLVTKYACEYELAVDLTVGSKLGYFNGIFFAIFQFNQFIGNLLFALLFYLELQAETIFIAATCISAFGAVCICFLRSPQAAPVEQVQQPWANLSMLKERRMLLLMPIILYNGLTQSFIFAVLPTFVDDDALKFFIMATFGFCDATFSHLLGTLSDRTGRKPILFFGCACQLLCFITIATNQVNQVGVFFLYACLLGFGDAALNTQPYAILGTFYPESPEAAFSNFKLLQSGTSAAAFFYGKYVSAETQCFICISGLVLGLSLLFFLDRFVQSIDAPKHDTKQNHCNIG